LNGPAGLYCGVHAGFPKGGAHLRKNGRASGRPVGAQTDSSPVTRTLGGTGSVLSFRDGVAEEGCSELQRGPDRMIVWFLLWIRAALAGRCVAASLSARVSGRRRASTFLGLGVEGWGMFALTRA
jgi:hypothetical protein